MTHLVPTPRVDKNGRTVLRHMKPEGADAVPAALTGLMPTLSDSNSDVFADMSDPEFLRYICPDNPEIPKYDEAFSVFVKMHPEARETLLSLVHLDDPNGSEAVREYLLQSLSSIRFRLNNAYPPANSRVDELMLDTDSLREAFILNWSVGSLRDEASKYFASTTTLATTRAGEVQRLLKRQGILFSYSDERAYWRAVGAASMIFHEESADPYELRDMIQWMETQQYLGDIIRVGAERNLRTPDAIKAILDAEGHLSLSSGVL